MVEPVQGAVADGAAFGDVRAGPRGQLQQVLVGILLAGVERGGQRGPGALPGQPGFLGISQRPEHPERAVGIPAKLGLQVLPHRLACLAGQPGLPGRAGGVGQCGAGGLGSGEHASDKEGPPRGRGDGRGDVVQYLGRAGSER